MATAVTLLGAASPSLAGQAGDAGRDSSFQSSRLLPRKRAPKKILCSLKYGCLGVDPGEATGAGRTTASPVYSSLTVKQAALLRRQLRPQQPATPAREMVEAMPQGGLKEAYSRCGEICEEYAKTFYLGTYGASAPSCSVLHEAMLCSA
jgi:phytoene synthase